MRRSAGMPKERKLFVRGFLVETRESDLRGHFARYGEVVHTWVVLDLESNKNRGFGFVEFAGEAATQRVLVEEERPNHIFRGCKVDVKTTERRPVHQQTEQSLHTHNTNQNQNGFSHKNQFINQKKLFVGGLNEKFTRENFIRYFNKFGTISDVVIMREKITKRPRGFGFITFASNEAICKVLQTRFHNLDGTTVEVKIAIPKSQTYYDAEDHRLRMLDMSLSPHCYDGMYPPYISSYYLAMVHINPYFYAQHMFGAQMMYSGYGYEIPTGHEHDLVGDDHNGHEHDLVGDNHDGLETVDTIKTEFDKPSNDLSLVSAQ